MPIKFPREILKPLEQFLIDKQALLKKRKKDLEKEDPYANTDRINDNAAIDTEAYEESGHERVSALKKEIDKALIQIKKTLTRIKIGKYGLCEHCGHMIDTDRLGINPTAILCISCEKQNSKKQTGK